MALLLISNRTRLIVDGAHLSKTIVNEKVQELISAVEKNWVELELESKTRGKRLQDAKSKAELSLKLNDADNRIKNLESELTKNYATNDLRGTKDALKKHLEIKKQIAVEIELLSDLNKVEGLKLGEKPNTENDIKSALKVYINTYNMLNPLIEEKQKNLQTEYNIQQLMFDVDEEVQWIQQSLKQVELMTQNMPQTLFEANNINKKLSELDRIRVNNHKSSYDVLVQKSDDLLTSLSKSNELASLESLREKKTAIENNWKILEKVILDKKALLAQCLQEQEELEELNQINIGLAEKLPIIKNSINENSNEMTISNPLFGRIQGAVRSEKTTKRSSCK